jgi:hypothetical protein
VDVEDVHEDRNADAWTVHERWLDDFANVHYATVGWSDDELLASIADPLGITEEVSDPQRDDRQYPSQGP